VKFLHPAQYFRDAHRQDYETAKLSDIEVLALVPGTGALTGGPVLLCRHSDVTRPEGFIVSSSSVKVDVAAAQSDRFDWTNPDRSMQEQQAAVVQSAAVPLDIPADSPSLSSRAAPHTQPDTSSTTQPNSITGSEDVDDDTLPLPENLSAPSDADVQVSVAEGWSHPGLCRRIMEGANHNRSAQLKGFTGDINDELDVFRHFFPMSFVEEVVIPQTNLAGGVVFQRRPLTVREFERWLGCIFVMSLYPATDRAAFWAKEQHPVFVAPSLAPYMTRKRFEAILQHLTIWQDPPVSMHVDRFFQLRQFFKAWHKNMSEHYDPGWLNCGDESMCGCDNPLCPGFIICPRKPTPRGNEYHTLADVETRIIYSFELLEGKDAPPGRYKEYSEQGITAGMMMRLCKPIHGSGRVVVWDSGFAVLKGLVGLKRLGVYSCIFIKKRKYWPKWVPSAAMKTHLEGKPLGTTAAKMCEYRGPECPEGIPWWLCGQKDSEYVNQLMCTYGTLASKGGPIFRGKAPNTRTFMRPEPMHDYYDGRNAVDNANNRRQGCVSIEDAFPTKSWWKRQFIFTSALSETNACNAFNHFGGHKVSSAEFRMALAIKLLGPAGEDAAMPTRVPTEIRTVAVGDTVGAHTLMTKPLHSGRWNGTEWARTSCAYQQHKCRTRGCKSQVRTYCSCNPCHPLCTLCWSKHVLVESS